MGRTPGDRGPSATIATASPTSSAGRLQALPGPPVHDPVRRDLAARLRQRELARTDEALEVRLEAIFRVGAKVEAADADMVRLGPQVLRAGRAPAEFEADEVVLLVVGEPSVAEPIDRELSDLERRRVARGRPDGSGPAGNTDRRVDRRLGDGGIEHPRREDVVRKSGPEDCGGWRRPFNSRRERECEHQQHCREPTPRGGRKPRFDQAARPWYSWMSPPSRSRRRTSRGLTGIGSRAPGSGEARARIRWGRPRL